MTVTAWSRLLLSLSRLCVSASVGVFIEDHVWVIEIVVLVDVNVDFEIVFIIVLILGLPFIYHQTSNKLDGIRIEKDTAKIEAISGFPWFDRLLFPLGSVVGTAETVTTGTEDEDGLGLGEGDGE